MKPAKKQSKKPTGEHTPVTTCQPKSMAVEVQPWSWPSDARHLNLHLLLRDHVTEVKSIINQNNLKMSTKKSTGVGIGASTVMAPPGHRSHTRQEQKSITWWQAFSAKLSRASQDTKPVRKFGSSRTSQS